MTIAREPLRALRHLVLGYEVNQPIPQAVIEEAMHHAGVTERWHLESFRPLNDIGDHLPERPLQWDLCFARTRQWLSEVQQALAEVGAAPVLHVIGRAPLPLMLHLGMLLDRWPVVAYQEDRATGTFRPAFDSRQALASGTFFESTGLPEEPLRGRGDIVMGVEVSRPIGDTDLRSLSPDPQLLGEVRLTCASGTGHTALTGAGAAALAVQEFRAALDLLHQNARGAGRVLLAIAAPAALAVGLGRAINPKAQHPLALFNYRPREGYVPVYTVDGSARTAPTPEWGVDEFERAARTAQRVAALHADLSAWLQEDGKEWADRVGGADFLRARVDPTPDRGPGAFDFHYLDGRLRLGMDFLLVLDRLSTRCDKEDSDELVRLFLLHEGYHLLQGLTTYNFQEIGRAGFVLECVDYDADVLAIEACLAWRRTQQPGRLRTSGELAAVADIIVNVLRGIRAFDDLDGRTRLTELPERRLRRYLIWYFQWARARPRAAIARCGQMRWTSATGWCWRCRACRPAWYPTASSSTPWWTWAHPWGGSRACASTCTAAASSTPSRMPPSAAVCLRRYGRGTARECSGPSPPSSRATRSSCRNQKR